MAIDFDNQGIQVHLIKEVEKERLNFLQSAVNESIMQLLSQGSIKYNPEAVYKFSFKTIIKTDFDSKDFF